MKNKGLATLKLDKVAVAWDEGRVATKFSIYVAMLGTAQKFHAHWFLYCSDNIQQDLAININCNNLNS